MASGSKPSLTFAILSLFRNWRFNEMRKAGMEYSTASPKGKKFLADHCLEMIAKLSRDNTLLKGYEQLAGRKPMFYIYSDEMAKEMRALCNNDAKYPAMLSVDRTLTCPRRAAGDRVTPITLGNAAG